MSSSDIYIQSLTEPQLRKVLEHIDSTHPDLVHAAVSFVLDEESVVTQQTSNKTPPASPPTRPPHPDSIVEEPRPELNRGARAPDMSRGGSAVIEDSPPPAIKNRNRPDISRGGSKPVVATNNAESLPTPPLVRHESIVRPRMACYLVQQGGTIIMQYSSTRIQGALAVFYSGPGQVLPSLGHSQVVGSSDNRRSYCNGWCQFVRAAKALNGCIILLKDNDDPYSVDLYLYSPEQGSIQVLSAGQQYELSSHFAVACLPKGTLFFGTTESVNLVDWMAKANLLGAASRF